MSATPEQMREISRRIAKVLDEHVKRCPACRGIVEFKLGPLVELKERNVDFLGFTLGYCVPVVPLVCPQCSIVTLFSAIDLGLVDPTTGRLNLDDQEPKP